MLCFEIQRICCRTKLQNENRTFATATCKIHTAGLVAYLSLSFSRSRGPGAAAFSLSRRASCKNLHYSVFCSHWIRSSSKGGETETANTVHRYWKAMPGKFDYKQPTSVTARAEWAAPPFQAGEIGPYWSACPFLLASSRGCQPGRPSLARSGSRPAASVFARPGRKSCNCRRHSP